MKTVLYCISLLLLSVVGHAQEQNEFVIRKIIELDSNTSANDIYKKALLFTKTKKDRFFISNGQRNVGWEIVTGRQKASDQYTTATAKAGIGYDSGDPEEKSIIAHCVFRYEGSMIGCPRLLIFNADIFIDCKDGKSKIEFRNFTYSHYNIADNRPENVAGKRCPANGTAEQLDECEDCGGTDKAIDFMIASAKKIAKEYKQFLLSVSVDKDDW